MNVIIGIFGFIFLAIWYIIKFISVVIYYGFMGSFEIIFRTLAVTVKVVLWSLAIFWVLGIVVEKITGNKQ